MPTVREARVIKVHLAVRNPFREKRGQSRRGLSWKWARWESGCRLDHLIAPAKIQVVDVRYLHEWRTDGPSDHSAPFALLSLADTPAPS